MVNLCPVDAVVIYPIISHGLSTLRKPLNLRVKKLIELAEIVLKNFNMKTYRHKRGTAVCTDFTLPYFFF